MIKGLMLFTAVCLMSFSASAQNPVTGDASAGEGIFKKCQACHVVEDDEGNKIAGRTGRVGPNLYGLNGRGAATVDGFRYSKALSAAGEAGLVWNEESFVAYVKDPNGFVREYLDDRRARGSMTFKLRDTEDALNLYAYLVSVGQ